MAKNTSSKPKQPKNLVIKVPGKVEKELEKINKDLSKSNNPHGALLNTATRRVRQHEKLHSAKFDLARNKMVVKGECLLNMILPRFTPSNEVYVIYKRIFLHPGILFSRKLALLSKMFSKYKFTEFRLEYCTQQSATREGAISFAYTKDYSTSAPGPNVNLLAWMGEMDGYSHVKVWEDANLPKMSIIGDLPSYYIDRSETDITTVYQNSLIIAMNTSLKNIYCGDLFCHYTIEFDVMDAPPVRFSDGEAYTTGGGSPLNNTLSWETTDASYISFWANKQGIYYCTLARAWDGFSRAADFTTRNYVGAPFILSVQAIQSTTLVSTYASIRYTVYPSMAALLDDNVVEVTGSSAFGNLEFECTQLMGTTPEPIESSNVLQTHAPKDQLSTISVGPGVIAGLPDVSPHFDFSGGRIHLGVHGPARTR